MMRPFVYEALLRKQDELKIGHLDFAPECEAESHPRGIAGHNGPATHLMTMPCGRQVLMCAGSVMSAVLARTTDPTTFVWCSKHDHALIDVTFTPLPEGNR